MNFKKLTIAAAIVAMTSLSAVAPVLAQAVVPVISGADGLTTLAPLPLNNQPGRLDVVAVTGQSATLEFELQSTP